MKNALYPSISFESYFAGICTWSAVVRTTQSRLYKDQMLLLDELAAERNVQANARFHDCFL